MDVFSKFQLTVTTRQENVEKISIAFKCSHIVHSLLCNRNEKNTSFLTLTLKNFEYLPSNGNQMWYGNTRFGFLQINLLSSIFTSDRNGFKSLVF